MSNAWCNASALVLERSMPPCFKTTVEKNTYLTRRTCVQFTVRPSFCSENVKIVYGFLCTGQFCRIAWRMGSGDIYYWTMLEYRRPTAASYRWCLAANLLPSYVVDLTSILSDHEQNNCLWAVKVFGQLWSRCIDSTDAASRKTLHFLSMVS